MAPRQKTGHVKEKDGTAGKERRTHPVIRSNTLELIALTMSTSGTAAGLKNLLLSCGVEPMLIKQELPMPQMISDVLFVLATSSDPQDHDTLYKVIREATNPVMFNGDKVRAMGVINQFNSYLQHDDFWLEPGRLFKRLGTFDDGSDVWQDTEGGEAEPRGFSIVMANLATVYVLWHLLIKITKCYLADKDAQDNELNDIYFEIIGKVEQTFAARGCGDLPTRWYRRPFKSLLGCELEWNQDTDKLLASLYDFLGRIAENEVPDTATIENARKENSALAFRIESYIAKHAVVEVKDSQQPTQPISVQIVGDVGIRGLEERVILQKPNNKRVQLKKFPSNLRWEEISMRFLNGHEVIVTARDLTLHTTYEELGFQDDKKKLPNKQWELLKALASNKGEASWANNHRMPPNMVDQLKKQKQLLSEALKAYFQVDGDPFGNYKAERAYRIKIHLIPEEGSQTTNERELFEE